MIDTAAFAWGFGEATLFFIVPDVLVTLIALFNVRRSLTALLSAVIGGVAGGLFMFAWAAHSPSAMTAVRHVPFVTPAMVAFADHGLRTSGAWTLFVGPTRGVPFKVYAAQAPGLVSPAGFALASAPARAERYLTTWPIYTLIGVAARRCTSRQTAVRRLLWAGWAIHWVTVYSIYWGIICR